MADAASAPVLSASAEQVDEPDTASAPPTPASAEHIASVMDQTQMTVREGSQSVWAIVEQLPQTSEGKAAEQQLAKMQGLLNLCKDGMVAYQGHNVPFQKRLFQGLWQQVCTCVQLKRLAEIEAQPLRARCKGANTINTSMIQSLEKQKILFEQNLPCFNTDHSAFASSLFPLMRSPISAEQSKDMAQNQDNLKTAQRKQDELQMKKAETAKEIAMKKCTLQLLDAVTDDAAGEVRDVTALRRRAAEFKAESDRREAQHGACNRSALGVFFLGKTNFSAEHQKTMADAMHARAEADVVKAQKDRRNLNEEKREVQGELGRLEIVFDRQVAQCQEQLGEISKLQEIVDADKERMKDECARSGGKTPAEIVKFNHAIKALMNPEKGSAKVQQNQHLVKPFIIESIDARITSLVTLTDIWSQLSLLGDEDPEEFTYNCNLMLDQVFESLFFALKLADSSSDLEIGKMRERAKDLGKLSLDDLGLPKKERPKRKAIQARQAAAAPAAILAEAAPEVLSPDLPLRRLSSDRESPPSIQRFAAVP